MFLDRVLYIVILGSYWDNGKENETTVMGLGFRV